MTPGEIEDAARRLLEAERTGVQCGLLSLAYPHMTLDDAYAVQAALVGRKRASGLQPIGWKIGLTSRAMQQALNITTPDSGILFDNMLFESGATVPAGRFIQPRIEAEIASVRDIDWQNMRFNYTLVFSPEPLVHAPHTYLASVMVDAAEEAGLQRAVAEAFPNITVVRVRDALDTVNAVLEQIGAAVRTIAVVTLAAGTLVLAGAVAAGHRRRVYDAVVLKVLGATRWRVLGTFLVEYGLLGALTAAIAALLGTLAAWAVLTFVMDIAWMFPPAPVAMVVVLATLVTLALGFAGTWHALGQKSAPLLRNE